MKRKTIILILGLFILFIGAADYMIYDNQSVFVGNRVKNPDCYTLEFTNMNQQDSHILALHEGDQLSFDYSIDTGKVSLSVGIESEDSIYRANDLDSGVFEVTIPKDGEYQVNVAAKHASGYIKVYVHEKDA